jgi:hypothetical protein
MKYRVRVSVEEDGKMKEFSLSCELTEKQAKALYEKVCWRIVQKLEDTVKEFSDV